MRIDPVGGGPVRDAPIPEVTEIAWVNGRLVPNGEPALRSDDRGIVGLGAFEAVKVVAGVPFALHRHLDRLVASASPLGIEVDLAAVRAGTDAVLATTPPGAPPFWLRITVTAGPGRMASAARASEPTVVASIAPMVVWGPAADVVVVPWSRNEHGASAGLKTVSYVDNARALRFAHDQGADEGLFANTVGNLCEGAGSNVFVVRDGTLVTPPLSAGCLAGITRSLLLERMPSIVEADVPVAELATCEEAFLTSTSRDVHPIRSIDGRTLRVAPRGLTADAQEAFAAVVRAMADAERP